MEKLAGNLKWNERISYAIISYTELFFYNLGCKVAQKPKTVITVSWLIVFLSCAGFFRFHQEKNPLKLWVPQKSAFVKDSDWLMSTIERGMRMETVIVEAHDVLTPEIFKQLAHIDKEIKAQVSTRGDKYENLCIKIPKISPTDDLITRIEFSCRLLDFLDEMCYEQNILELWDYSPKELANLTKEEILYRVNKYKRHPIFSNIKVYESLLGGVVRNKSGHIVSASHLNTMWSLNVNYSAINIEETGNTAGTSDFASEEALAWELTYLNTMKDLVKYMNNVTIYYMSARSFGDISNVTMFQDFDILAIGVCIVIIYLQLAISKFNWVEGRVLLSLMGLMNIGMAFLTGCGFCSLLGISYGPVHTSLPFLLMGLGVDDMFVILSSWEDLTEEQQKLPLHERVGTMLKHAGVSISVTTFTDIVAFLIGSITVIPSLQSFCLYAAFCVLMTFVFLCTFYVACFTFDAKRISANRNCIFPWKKYINYKKNECSQKKLSNKIIELVYSRIILTWPGKLLVLLIVIIMTGFSIEGILKLEQRFDPLWFIPSDSYMAQYVKTRKEIYPQLGYEASLFIGSVNYTHEFKNIRTLNDNFENSIGIITNLNSWVPEYQKFVWENTGKDIYEETLPEHDFQMYLSDFLFRNGSKFQPNFQFHRQLKCGEPAPKIQVAWMDFRLKEFTGPEEHVPAMRKLNDMAAANNFTTGDRRSFVWSTIFATWITDEIIEFELARNIILALICVMLCTLILIADFQTCFWIFICVLVTMINVAGLMPRWGITIDITSCIALQLAIGLCVDYATHIGYTFLTIVDEDRNRRSLKTVVRIGLAVMYGASSTLIAVLMLAGSDAYAFKIFFKLFFMVTSIGLFNGVVLLPVILSWFGPKPCKSHSPVQQNDLKQ